MAHPANKYATFAYLDEDYVPVLCTEKKANGWFWSKDHARSLIRSEIINSWGIYTRFRRFSLEADGPPLFWRVCCFTKAESPLPFEVRARWFGTKEAALEFHAVVAAALAREDTVDDDLIPLESRDDYETDEDEEGDSADWWKE